MSIQYACIDPPRITGARWCYQGPHCFTNLPKRDKRVFRSTNVDLVFNSRLQEEIDKLDHSHTKHLTIRMGTFYDDSLSFSLAIHLPSLEKLVLDGIKFKEIILNDKLTPSITDLTMVNVGDISNMNFQVQLPTLQTLSISYMESDSLVSINEMLTASNVLVSFQSYKLWVAGDIPLTITSDALESISIRRSDCLSSVAFWAPKLQSLDLIAMFDLSHVDILAEHPGWVGGEKHPTPLLTKFLVDVTNSVGFGSEDMLQYLISHPRVESIQRQQDEDGSW